MDPSPIREITILPGRNRNGEPERFDAIAIRPGDTISIVGPTGSGKSALINDIEVFARNDTATGRTVLVNGEYPPEEFVRDPAHKPVAVNYLRLKSGACYRVGYHALYRLAIPPLPRASGEQTAIGSLTRALAAMFFAAFRSAFSA